MGDGVNIASRLEEDLRSSGGVCLSEDAYRQVKSRLRTSKLPTLRATEPQEHRRAGCAPICCAKARLRPQRNRPKQQQKRAASGRVGLRWPPGSRLCFSRRGPSPGCTGYTPRFLAASVDDKLANAPRLSIVVLPFENLGGDPESSSISPMGSPTILRLIFLTFPIASLSPATLHVLLHSKAGRRSRRESDRARTRRALHARRQRPTRGRKRSRDQCSAHLDRDWRACLGRSIRGRKKQPRQVAIRSRRTPSQFAGVGTHEGRSPAR